MIWRIRSNLLPPMLRRWWVQTGLVAIAYIVTGRLAQLMAISPGHATAVWPAAGVALVAALRFGLPGVVGVALGSFCVHLTSAGIGIAAALCIGSAAQALLGGWLVSRALRGDDRLATGRDIAAFMMLGGPIACLVAPTWGALVLYATGEVDVSQLPFSWLTWWVGDTIGVLLAAPILLGAFATPRSVWRPRIVTVALPLAVSSAGVIVAFVMASHSEAERSNNELERRASVIAFSVRERIERYVEGVKAAASYISANPSLPKQRFAAFASGALGSDRGAQVLAWCPRVTPATRPSFERAAREQLGSFAIKTQGFDGLIVAPDRPEMFPSLYVEPTSPNVGFDIASEPVRADALARARATGGPAVSRPLKLLSGSTGFLVVAPVYSLDDGGTFLGAAVGGASIGLLLRDATDQLASQGFRLSIVDVTTEPQLLVGSLDASPWTQAIGIAGRTWRIGVARIAPPGRSLLAWLVLAGGLAFVGVVGSVLLAITGGRGRIMEAEARYRDLYENAPDGYLTVTAEGEITECNTAAATSLGYARGELVGKSLVDLAGEASKPFVEQALVMLANHGSVDVPQLTLHRKSGAERDASLSATAVYRGEHVVAARVLVRDITDLVTAERDHRFQVELGDLLHGSESARAVFVRTTTQVSEYLGLDKCHFAEIEQDTKQVVVHQYARGKKKESDEIVPISSFEAVGLTRLLDGARLVVDDMATDERFARVYEAAYAPREIRAFVAIPLMRGGQCVAYFGAVSATARHWTTRDVSLVQSVAERAWLWSEHLRSLHHLRDLSHYLEARVEERTHALVDALTEKEALLKEIHHRVKNNLQVISSMLRLQARRIPMPELRDVFDESQQRIQTIALVHERLYQSRDLSNIGFDDYLKSLVENVMYAQNATDRGVTAITEVTGVSLPIQIAIPCGLIVNELVTNSLKHAFPGDRTGTITVSMQSEGNKIELSVADDGVGLPANVDPSKAKTLGLDLVYTFAEQLDATVAVRSARGTAFTLRFAV
ncbi:MAG: PAS domain S-box protein [Kofleriaceae bacterium]|nr:PAS domain S-box protein [Kofleriaceae bacterium]